MNSEEQTSAVAIQPNLMVLYLLQMCDWMLRQWDEGEAWGKGGGVRGTAMSPACCRGSLE